MEMNKNRAVIKTLSSENIKGQLILGRVEVKLYESYS